MLHRARMSKKPRLLKIQPKRADGDGDNDNVAASHHSDYHNAYKISTGDCCWDHYPVRRPFPASHFLSVKDASSGKNEKPSPLLRSFLSAFGKEPKEATPTHDEDEPQDNGEGNKGEKANESTATINAATIDDPAQSTLKFGQHQRYLALMSSRQDWKPPQRKEFRKINALVEDEQQKYRQAVVTFWEANRERVFVGFSQSSSSTKTSEFAKAAAFPSSVRDRWKQVWGDVRYGKYRQLLSLEQQSHANKRHQWSVDTIESQNIEGTSNTSATDQAQPLPPVGMEIPTPNKERPFDFLVDDDKARDFAAEHKADIVTTVETIESLLKIEDAQWMIPIAFRNNSAFLDLPVPQPYLSPRDCLTQAFENGMQEGLVASWTTNSEERSETKRDLYDYKLMTMPTTSSRTMLSSSRHKVNQIRILVRIPRCTVRAHAHLEYFPERGEEIPSSYERSLWILDQLLFSKSVVGRVNPSTCKLMKWEETSVAHALAGGSNNHQSAISGQYLDPMDHWYRLGQLFQGVPTISRSGNFLLCLPGKGLHLSALSASVHEETKNESDIMINIDTELQRAGEVILGTSGVRRSIREWSWNAERIPYTFPISEE